MIKAVLVRGFTEEHLPMFSDIEGYEFSVAGREVTDFVREAEVILGSPTDAQMKAAVKARWIQISSSGAAQYLDPARGLREDVTLTTNSGAFGQSISEYVLTMVLALYKKLQLYRDNQNECLWKDWGVQETPCGKELLILGAGNIGENVARLFAPFGCRITGFRRNASEPVPGFDRIIGSDGLDDAMRDADIIVGCLPGTPETYKLLSRERLSMLKSSAVVINVGRGSLIDSDALADMLEEGKLAGAGLDVTDPEPLTSDHRLWRCRNCIITPHISGSSFGHLKATELKMYGIFRDNLVRYRDGMPLLNVFDRSTGYRVLENRA
ncbi:MAG: D-2-hydroxyacid dehydrogenase [Eubacteriales bacterium]|nr:D-2-hydroxyacid dehydrogenase [Eubacteriales bacterium]